MKCFFGVACLSIIILAGCESPQFPTVKIYDSPNRFVRLEVYEDGNDGKEGYSHPAFLSEESIARVMRGLFVEAGGGTRSRAFSDEEIEFFAPLFVKGLNQATPEEIVTFFETAEISSLDEITTSGGVFVRGNALHVLLSNYSVKTQIWQTLDEDNAQYRSPPRLRPLDPIDAQPGRLVFELPQFMIEPSDGGWIKALKGRPWHVAVLYKDLSRQ